MKVFRSIRCSILIAIVSWVFIPRTSAQNPGDLRLIDRSGMVALTAGRLEMYGANGAWGTVCAQNFEFFEGDIACRQMGFLYADRVGTVGELGFTIGSGEIGFNNVQCAIDTIRLYDCRNGFINPDCNHLSDVALRCSNSANQIRLVSQTGRTNADGISAGRLELFINDQWGTVCNDGFEIGDAHVACRQLGYSEAVGVDVAASQGYTADLTSPIWLDEVTCNDPSSSNLRLCDNVGTGQTNCDHFGDVIVSCLADGNLRIAATPSGNTDFISYYGRLEIYLNNQWGTICSNGFTGTSALVACQQLGYTTYNRYGTNLGYPPATPTIPIWLENVRCLSTDRTLLTCPRSDVGFNRCVHTQDVQVECGFSGTPPPPPPPTVDNGGNNGGNNGGGSSGGIDSSGSSGTVTDNSASVAAIVGGVVGTICFLLFILFPIVIVVIVVSVLVCGRPKRNAYTRQTDESPQPVVLTGTGSIVMPVSYQPGPQQAPPPRHPPTSQDPAGKQPPPTSGLPEPASSQLPLEGGQQAAPQEQIPPKTTPLAPPPGPHPDGQGQPYPPPPPAELA